MERCQPVASYATTLRLVLAQPVEHAFRVAPEGHDQRGTPKVLEKHSESGGFTAPSVEGTLECAFA